MGTSSRARFPAARKKKAVGLSSEAQLSPKEKKGGVVGLLRRFTIEQWLAIDAEYREPKAASDWRAASVMLLVAVTLSLQRYFGGRRFFNRNLSHLTDGWPYEHLWQHLYWSFGCAVTYFVIPGLFAVFVLRHRLRDYGFKLQGAHRHIPIYLGMFMIVLPFVIAASTSSSFQHRYPFYGHAGDSWTELLTWELAYALQFVMLEFFFRGFVLFTLARFIGAYAIFVMVIPYTMIHFGKPFPETMGAIIAGTALGTLALRTRSIAGGVFIHIAVAWLMDILALLQKDKLQGLF